MTHNKIDVLLNAISLIYRESNAKDNSITSKDLIYKVLDVIEPNKKFSLSGGDNNTLENLLSYVKELVDNYKEGDIIDKQMIIQSVSLTMVEQDEVLKIFIDGLNNIDDEKTLANRINQLKRFLYGYYREIKLQKIASSVLFNITQRRGEIKNFDEYIEKVKQDLEVISTDISSMDPAVVDEIDLADSEALSVVVDSVKDGLASGTVFKTGWKALNEMTQGGIRKSEYFSIGALPHNYKTGFSLSVFVSILMFNQPVLKDPEKKPLAVWISLEDPIKNILEFIYILLHMSESGKMPSLGSVSTDEVITYVQTRLKRNGFDVKILRVNPTEWTYKDIINKVITYGTQGYEVQVLGVDYLYMIPTTGCNTSGPTGTDIRDLIRRVRNFCSSQNIAFMSPVQLSPAAKQLTRSGIPPFSFVKEVANKGYYSGSTQLDQEFDLSVIVHKVTMNRKSYLTVQREKHRLPTTVEDEKLYFFIPFPKKGAIPFDVDKDTAISMRDPSEIGGNAPSGTGGFGL